MAQTTLNLRLLLTMQRSRATFSIVAMGLLLLSSSFVTGCGSAGDGELPTSAASGEDGSAVPTGPASASLAWDPVSGVLGYMIHYGTHSPGPAGSCAYQRSAFSSTPSVTVEGLAADTTYYFAVSSYNGLESPCSAEVATVTGSA
jgi:hypothetical protein